MKVLVPLMMSVMAAGAASADPLYVFNNYSGGYLEHCHVEEFSGRSLKGMVSYLDPKAKVTLERFTDQGATVYRERVLWSNGKYFVAMATDNELYCLRNVARWGHQMQSEFDAHATPPAVSKPPQP